MNRFFWTMAFLLLAAATPWAQSTWRGQAEIWTANNLPADGLVAASNEFPPLNSLLTVENYKSKKTVQVRVVAPLPAGSSDLVLVSPKAAAALEMKPGEVPLVGVRIDTAAADRPDNPDPDVNPLAEAPPTTTSPAPAALPLPATAEPVPLAVANEPDEVPSTPGKRVFESTKNPEPLVAAPQPADSTSEAPAAASSPAAEPAGPVQAAPSVSPPVVAVVPRLKLQRPPAPAPAVPMKVVPANLWVAEPSKLNGPVLGQIPVLASLEKGRPYVQLGSWATEADMLATLDSVKSYVPLALYKADGQKNPWRVLAAAPKNQLGVLLMLFRSEGLRSATVVKG